MMGILLAALFASPPCAPLSALPETPVSPAYGGVAAIVVGGLSLATRLRRR